MKLISMFLKNSPFFLSWNPNPHVPQRLPFPFPLRQEWSWGKATGQTALPTTCVLCLRDGPGAVWGTLSPIHFNFYPWNIKDLLVFPSTVGGSFLASHFGRRTVHQCLCTGRPWRSQSQGLGTDQGTCQQDLNLSRRRLYFLDADPKAHQWWSACPCPLPSLLPLNTSGLLNQRTRPN